MKIDCVLKAVGECRSGDNATTGRRWFIRPIEVEWQENRLRGDGTTYTIDNTLKVDLFGEHAQNFSLAVGSNVTIDVRFETSIYNGKTINSIRSTFIILR
mgnify:CR=1 FL=1